MRRRRGIALVIVFTLFLLLAFMAGMHFFLVSGETDRTAARSHEIQAAMIGEGVANRITTLINRWPWSDRFHAKLGQGGRYGFTEKTFPFGPGDPLTHQPEVTFRGVISDLAAPLSYRIKVEVFVAGQRVLMLFDKVHSTSLLSAASDGGTLLSTHSDGPQDSTLDALVDQVKKTSRKNRPLGAVDPILADTIDAAILDRQSGKNPAKVVLGVTSP